MSYFKHFLVNFSVKSCPVKLLRNVMRNWIGCWLLTSLQKNLPLHRSTFKEAKKLWKRRFIRNFFPSSLSLDLQSLQQRHSVSSLFSLQYNSDNKTFIASHKNQRNSLDMLFKFNLVSLRTCFVKCQEIEYKIQQYFGMLRYCKVLTSPMIRWNMWYDVICCDMLWYAVTCCDMLWYAVICCDILWNTAIYCNMLPYDAIHFVMMRYALICCNML